MRTLLLLLASGATLLGPRAAAAPLNSPPPPAGRYCTPVAYRDYEVLVGRAAALRPLPGCRSPSLVRKVSSSGEAGAPIAVPLPTPSRPLVHVWLFLHHLEYTLDGRSWARLRLIP